MASWNILDDTVSWGNVSNIPSDFSDGKINWGEIQNKPLVFPSEDHAHAPPTNLPSLSISGDLSVAGFINSDVGFKVKRLTGVTSPNQGGTVSVAHGCSFSKILSVSGFIIYVTNGAVFPSHTHNSGYHFNLFLDGSSVSIFNNPTNSINILSKPFVILVFYSS